MLRKPIKYKDLDGNPIEEEFYFNFSKPELVEMMVSQKGGLDTYVKRIVESNDNKEIVALLKDIIVKSIGRRSPDGRYFEKSDQIAQEFVQSDAYSELFMEFFTDENAGANFVNAVIPADLREQVEAELAKKPEDVQLPAAEDEGAKLLAENRDLTAKEFAKLNSAQQAEAYQAKMARDTAAS